MARLVLYSDGGIPENEPIHQGLMRMLGKNQPTIGFIPSADDPGGIWSREKVAHYDRLGARLELSFGLDDDVYDVGRLPDLLACDAIHLSGGNTYGFLHRLRRRGMMEVLWDYVAGGGVLIGTSAGAILMTPEISTAALCGDRNEARLTDLSGLGLVDFLFWPHYEGGTWPYDLLTYGCPDGAGIIVDGETITLFGGVVEV